MNKIEMIHSHKGLIAVVVFLRTTNHNAWKLIKTSLDESFYEGPVRLSKNTQIF